MILRTKLPSKNQRVDCPCLATSLVNDPSLRGEGREIHLTLTEILNDGNRAQLEGLFAAIDRIGYTNNIAANTYINKARVALACKKPETQLDGIFAGFGPTQLQ